MKLKVTFSNPVRNADRASSVVVSGCTGIAIRGGRLFMTNSSQSDFPLAEIIAAVPGLMFYRIAGEKVNDGYKGTIDFRTMTLEAE